MTAAFGVSKTYGIYAESSVTVNNSTVKAYGENLEASGESCGIYAKNINAAYSNISACGGNASGVGIDVSSYGISGKRYGDNYFSADIVGCTLTAIGGSDAGGGSSNLTSYGMYASDINNQTRDEGYEVQFVGSRITANKGSNADLGYGLYIRNNVLISCQSDVKADTVWTDGNYLLKSRSSASSEEFTVAGKHHYSSGYYDYVSGLYVTDNSEMTVKSSAEVAGNISLTGGKLVVSEAGLTLTGVTNINGSDPQYIGGILAMTGGALSVNGDISAAAINISGYKSITGTSDNDFSDGITKESAPIAVTYNPLFCTNHNTFVYDASAPVHPSGYSFAGWSYEEGNLADKTTSYEDGKCYYAVWQNDDDIVVISGKLDFKDATTQYMYSTQYNNSENGRNGLAFDTATKQVTMNGAVIDSYEEYGIRTPNKTNIILSKDTYITVHADEARFDDDDENPNRAWVYGINSNQEVNLSGTSILYITVDADEILERYSSIPGITMTAIGIQAGHDTTIGAKVKLDIRSANYAYGFYMGNNGHGYTFSEGSDVDINITASDQAVGIEAGKPLDFKNANVNITINENCADSVGLKASNAPVNIENSSISIQAATAVKTADNANKGGIVLKKGYISGQNVRAIPGFDNYLYSDCINNSASASKLTVLTRSSASAPVVFTSTTNTISFETNGGSSVASQSVYGYLDASNNKLLTTKAGMTFAGWYKDSKFLKTFTPENDYVTSDMTLYAKWEAQLCTVSGIVQNDEGIPAKVTGVSLILKKGNNIFGTAVSNDSGEFTIENVPAGDYQLILKKDDACSVCNLSVAGTVSDLAFTLPAAKWSSVRIVYGAPDIAADGLSQLASSYSLAGDESNVLFSLTAESKEYDSSNAEMKAIKQLSTDASLEYIDFKLSISTNGAVASDYGAENASVLAISMPYYAAGTKTNVYRYEGGAERLTELTAKPSLKNALDGSFYVDKESGRIYIYASKFSSYAVGRNVSFDDRFGGKYSLTGAESGYKSYSSLNISTEYTLYGDTAYTFGGWFTGIDGTGEALNGEPVSGLNYYAKWINGGRTVVTSTVNFKANPNSEYPADCGISWNSESKTLTLAGVTIDTKNQVGLNLTPGSIIVVEGTNTVRSTLQGDASNKKTAGIYSDQIGSLIITGNGILNVSSGSITQIGDEGKNNMECLSAGVYVNGNLTISGLTLNAESGNTDFGVNYVTSIDPYRCGRSMGIRCMKQMSIVNAIVTAKAGDGSLESTKHNGFSIGIQSYNNLDIINSTVNALSGYACQDSIGIFAGNDYGICTPSAYGENDKYLANIVIEKSNVCAKAGKACSDSSEGIYCHNSIYITDSKVEAENSKTTLNKDHVTAGLFRNEDLVITNSSILVNAYGCGIYTYVHEDEVDYAKTAVFGRTYINKGSEVTVNCLDADLAATSCALTACHILQISDSTLKCNVAVNGAKAVSFNAPNGSDSAIEGFVITGTGRLETNGVVFADYTSDASIYFGNNTDKKYSVTGSETTVLDGSASVVTPNAAVMTIKPYSEEKQNDYSGSSSESSKVKTVTEEAIAAKTFVDVKSEDYFHDAVAWAVSKGITNGTDETHFAPGEITTRAQMVTFRWRAAGCPQPASAGSRFTDIKSEEYYYEAVLWAVEQGIAKGISETSFAPDKTVTRGQSVTFLARNAGIKDEASGYSHNFTDVTIKDYYNNAVSWAASNGITTGINATSFAPDSDCERGQVVTFIYRAMAK